MAGAAGPGRPAWAGPLPAPAPPLCYWRCARIGIGKITLTARVFSGPLGLFRRSSLAAVNVCHAHPSPRPAAQRRPGPVLRRPPPGAVVRPAFGGGERAAGGRNNGLRHLRRRGPGAEPGRPTPCATWRRAGPTRKLSTNAASVSAQCKTTWPASTLSWGWTTAPPPACGSWRVAKARNRQERLGKRGNGCAARGILAVRARR